jgi:putative redox protein
MSAIEVIHAKDDRFLIDIRGHGLVVDQPKEAGGGDVGPTPTELFVSSLAACVGFYAERFLRRHDLPPQGLRVEADFDMAPDGAARVSSVTLRVHVPAELSAGRRIALLSVIQRCTVHNSLAQPPALRLELEAPWANAA